jgi:hypothetical protein
MKSKQNPRHIQSKNNNTHKSTIGAYTTGIDRFEGHNTSIPQPTMFTPQQMDERREKNIVFQL